MKRIKLSKAGMLIKNKEFHRDCNELRKLINKSSGDYIPSDKDGIAYDISIQFEVMLYKYNVGFRTICDVIRTTTTTIKKIIAEYPLFTGRKKYTPQSYLEDRQYYARLIIDGGKTIQEVANDCDVVVGTVYYWVRDYKKFGNKMTNQAIAFRRVL